jgi:hypothetical protein
LALLHQSGHLLAKAFWLYGVNALMACNRFCGPKVSSRFGNENNTSLVNVFGAFVFITGFACVGQSVS